MGHKSPISQDNFTALYSSATNGERIKGCLPICPSQPAKDLFLPKLYVQEMEPAIFYLSTTHTTYTFHCEYLCKFNFVIATTASAVQRIWDIKLLNLKTISRNYTAVLRMVREVKSVFPFVLYNLQRTYFFLYYMFKRWFLHCFTLAMSTQLRTYTATIFLMLMK